MRCSFVIAAATLTLAACADRPGAGGDMSGDSPANFSFRSDDQHALATIAAAEDGKPVTWTVSSSSFGAVQPVAAQYADLAGRPCRGLKQDRTRGGDTTSRDVTACKGGDGTWVVSDYRPEKKAD
jgi:surface antigen